MSSQVDNILDIFSITCFVCVHVLLDALCRFLDTGFVYTPDWDKGVHRLGAFRDMMRGPRSCPRPKSYLGHCFCDKNFGITYFSNFAGQAASCNVLFHARPGGGFSGGF